MSQVISSETLANGLRAEFYDTYMSINNRQADSRLNEVMDNLTATNRQHEFAYYEAAPHMDYWRRGDTIPTDAFKAVQFSTPVYTWGRRVPWHKEDRKDDQTKSLLEVARMAGQSAALLPIRFFFDLITKTTTTLPAIPLAPDGVDMYANNDATGSPRFGVTNGNLLSGAGVTVSNIKDSYYAAIEQFKSFQDGKGQPLLSDEVVDAGVTIIHPIGITDPMEEAFIQQRHIISSQVPSNVMLDANRKITLWGTSRLSGNSYYIFLKNPPKKPTFLLDREGITEYSSLEGDNNGDHTRNTGEEYVQWERRAGAGIALPYGTIKITVA